MAGPADPREREAFELAVSRQFPDLPDAEREAVWQCWSLVQRWLARLPRELPYEDEPAHIFSPPERRR